MKHNKQADGNIQLSCLILYGMTTWNEHLAKNENIYYILRLPVQTIASVLLPVVIFFTLELLAMWSLRSHCQWALVQQWPCSAFWIGVNRRKVEDVRLLDYQAAHSTAFVGLVCDNWHDYTDWVPSADLQAYTLYGTAHGHSVKSLCSQHASHPRGMCVYLWCDVCPWAHGCWRGRLSCGQMLQDTAPIQSPVWPGRIMKRVFMTAALLYLGCELLFEQKANKETKTNCIQLTVKPGTWNKVLFFELMQIQSILNPSIATVCPCVYSCENKYARLICSFLLYTLIMPLHVHGQ